MDNMTHVEIYTDGACIRNPGPGGYGVVLRYGDYRRELSGGFRETTNNRMEILAAIEGLRALKQRCTVSLYCDSQYVVKMMQDGWPRKWHANGWRKATGGRALNADLWEVLLRLCDEHDVTFLWVKGHAGHTVNEQCDRLARRAALRPDLPVDEGYERATGQRLQAGQPFESTE